MFLSVAQPVCTIKASLMVTILISLMLPLSAYFNKVLPNPVGPSLPQRSPDAPLDFCADMNCNFEFFSTCSYKQGLGVYRPWQLGTYLSGTPQGLPLHFGGGQHFVYATRSFKWDKFVLESPMVSVPQPARVTFDYFQTGVASRFLVCLDDLNHCPFVSPGASNPPEMSHRWKRGDILLRSGISKVIFLAENLQNSHFVALDNIAVRDMDLRPFDNCFSMLQTTPSGSKTQQPESTTESITSTDSSSDQTASYTSSAGHTAGNTNGSAESSSMPSEYSTTVALNLTDTTMGPQTPPEAATNSTPEPHASTTPPTQLTTPPLPTSTPSPAVQTLLPPVFSFANGTSIEINLGLFSLTFKALPGSRLEVRLNFTDSMPSLAAMLRNLLNGTAPGTLGNVDASISVAPAPEDTSEVSQVNSTKVTTDDDHNVVVDATTTLVNTTPSSVASVSTHLPVNGKTTDQGFLPNSTVEIASTTLTSNVTDDIAVSVTINSSIDTQNSSDISTNTPAMSVNSNDTVSPTELAVMNVTKIDAANTTVSSNDTGTITAPFFISTATAVDNETFTNQTKMSENSTSYTTHHPFFSLLFTNSTASTTNVTLLENDTSSIVNVNSTSSPSTNTTYLQTTANPDDMIDANVTNIVTTGSDLYITSAGNATEGTNLTGSTNMSVFNETLKTTTESTNQTDSTVLNDTLASVTLNTSETPENIPSTSEMSLNTTESSISNATETSATNYTSQQPTENITNVTYASVYDNSTMAANGSAIGDSLVSEFITQNDLDVTGLSKYISFDDLKHLKVNQLIRPDDLNMINVTHYLKDDGKLDLAKLLNLGDVKQLTDSTPLNREVFTRLASNPPQPLDESLIDKLNSNQQLTIVDLAGLLRNLNNPATPG